METAKSKARNHLLDSIKSFHHHITSDSSTQTDTHIAYDGKRFVNHQYCWNEWELRRRALSLVNLRYKATHSTQTFESHFRRDAQSQCYVHGKQNATQTKTETATGMPKKITYLQGLRGEKIFKNKLHHEDYIFNK